MSGEEKRIHARLQGSLEIEFADATGTSSASLRDLSQGGASFVSGRSLSVGDAIALLLPSPDDQARVPVQAIVRRAAACEGGFSCGVQFTELQATKLAAVDYLLGVLFSSPGGERRKHPRISRRISVSFETPEELLGMIENISLGGLALTLEEEIAVGEILLVVLPADDGEDLLSLTGRVANSRVLEEFDPPLFLVGLEFTEMSPQRLALLDAMLNSMLKLV